jgi:hypothetical protein
MIKLIFGREPQLPTGKKLAPLWEALRKDPQAWVGIELADLKYNSPSLARANVRSAGHREDLAVDVIIDGTVEGIDRLRVVDQHGCSEGEERDNQQQSDNKTFRSEAHGGISCCNLRR